MGRVGEKGQLVLRNSGIIFLISPPMLNDILPLKILFFSRCLEGP